MLGQGGFGAVYRARQLATGQPVAIKVMHARTDAVHAAGGDDAQHAASRFEREMQLIARLKHPNIVGLVDSGRLDAQRLFLVLEYIEGLSLSQLLARSDGGLPLRQTLRLMTQVLEALGFAHARGVVHRDLKPHNIMVSEPQGRANAVVLDFGIAKLVEDARGVDYRSLTGEDQIPGTPAYMAPEQLNRGPLSGASDIYAWGLVFLECLTGRPVLDPDEGVIPTLFWQLSEAPVPLPDALRGTALEALLRRATAKPLAQRYESAEAALEALERLAQSGDEVERLEHALQLPDIEPTLDVHVGMAQALAAVGASPPAARTDEDTTQLERAALHTGMLDDPRDTLPAGTPAPVVATPRAPGSDVATSAPPRARREAPAVLPAPLRPRSRRWLPVALAALVAVGTIAALALALSGSDGDDTRETATGSTTAGATLRVDALTPHDAEILLDGRRLGRGAGRYEGLAPGSAVLAVRAPGHEAQLAEVELRAGAEVTLGQVALRALDVAVPAEMVHVPTGAFWRGCAEGEPLCGDDERPGSLIVLPGFFIDRTEVSVAAYRACVEAGACEPAATGFPGAPEQGCNAGVAGRDHLPVNCVTYAQAAAYCAWVGKRLPSEAEWEKAARGTDRRQFPWGNEVADCTRAVMTASDGRDGCAEGRMAHVFSRPAGASPYGALNMAGNADEWVADFYVPDAYGLEASARKDPRGPLEGTLRASRGGGFDDDLLDMRAAARDSELPGELDTDQGFRCARPVAAK